MESIKLVEQFHKVFDHPIADKPTIIGYDRLKFRTGFLEEEIEGLKEAWADNSIIDIADAIGDIQYVLDGFILECGLQDYKQAILEEIHRSNMSKACKTEIEAFQLCTELLETTKEYGFHYRKIGDNYIVYRSDGKTMKSKNYFKPNLKSIIC